MEFQDVRQRLKDKQSWLYELRGRGAGGDTDVSTQLESATEEEVQVLFDIVYLIATRDIKITRAIWRMVKMKKLHNKLRKIKNSVAKWHGKTLEEKRAFLDRFSEIIPNFISAIIIEED